MESSAGFIEVPLENNSQNKQDWQWMGQSICLQVNVLCFNFLKTLRLRKTKTPESRIVHFFPVLYLKML